MDAVLALSVRCPPAGHDTLRAEGAEALLVGGHVPHPESAFVTQHGAQVLSSAFIRPAFLPADNRVPGVLPAGMHGEVQVPVKGNRGVVEGEERGLLHHVRNGGLHRDACGGFQTCLGWRFPARKLQKAWLLKHSTDSDTCQQDQQEDGGLFMTS